MWVGSVAFYECITLASSSWASLAYSACIINSFHSSPFFSVHVPYTAHAIASGAAVVAACVLLTALVAITDVGAVSPPPKPWPSYSLQNMPRTGFVCRGKILGGYYADAETQCQMFHVCVKVAGVGVSVLVVYVGCCMVMRPFSTATHSCVWHRVFMITCCW